jgi:hypothetical protein
VPTVDTGAPWDMGLTRKGFVASKTVQHAVTSGNRIIRVFFTNGAGADWNDRAAPFLFL